MTRRRRRLLTAAIVLVLLALAPTAVAWTRALISKGDTFVSVPPSGPGWRVTSTIVGAMGRQYLRSDVLTALTTALTAAAAAEPGRVFIVADTGHADGGDFPPHATHKDGRSIDILVPLRDERGAPTSLSTWPWNLWGYCWHLDDAGDVRGLKWEAKPVEVPLVGTTRLCPSIDVDSTDRIDFEATARLLVELERAAKTQGLRVGKIIIEPAFIAPLLKTTAGAPLDRARFVRGHVWVRHDEHVHVDLVPR